MRATFIVVTAAVLLSGCVSSVTTESGSASAPSGSTLAGSSSALPATSPAASSSPNPTGTRSAGPALDRDVAERMLEFIVDSSSPLARIQENTDNFNTDFGYKIADPTVILPAVKEVKPLLLEAMRLPSLGDAELDEEWNSYTAGLDRAMENLEKAFAAGNKYGESDYLMAALDLSLYATYVEGFIEKLGDRING